MSMLRDFVYNPGNDLVLEVLNRFDTKSFDIADRQSFILLKFEVITPDSFMWRVIFMGNVCYLYAEDHVPSLDHIKKVFNNYTGSRKWELIESKTKKAFNETGPVIAATTYEEPDDSEELMKYAVDSGHDFIFLCRSSEKTEDALFSDEAPNGFIIV